MDPDAGDLCTKETACWCEFALMNAQAHSATGTHVLLADGVINDRTRGENALNHSGNVIP